MRTDPEVDEEVCEVIDEVAEEEVATGEAVCCDDQDERRESENSQDKHTRSNFHRLQVLRFHWSAPPTNDKHTITCTIVQFCLLFG